MGLFFDILTSINSPKQAGKLEDLREFVSSIQTASNKEGFDPILSQTILSELTDPVRSFLLNNDANEIMTALTTGNDLSSQLSPLLSQVLGSNFLHGLTQKTGLNNHQVKGIIPVIIPALFKVFSMGHSQKKQSPNKVLEAFLSANNPDLGGIMKYSTRMLGAFN